MKKAAILLALLTLPAACSAAPSQSVRMDRAGHLIWTVRWQNETDKPEAEASVRRVFATYWQADPKQVYCYRGPEAELLRFKTADRSGYLVYEVSGEVLQPGQALQKTIILTRVQTGE